MSLLNFQICWSQHLFLLCMSLLLGGLPVRGHTGQLSPDQLAAFLRQDVSDSLILGERHASVPVWPVFRPVASGLGGTPPPELYAFLFESVDVEPVRGYSGKPINLLILMTPAGKLLSVDLVNHSEPIFGGEAGFAELATFSRQYDGLTVNHEIQIFRYDSIPSRNDTVANLHGILRGTVTAHAINKSILSAAVQVAEAQLANPNAAVSGFGSVERNERFERMGWNPLLDTGLIQRIEIENRDIESRFDGTTGAKKDSMAIIRPRALGIDAWIASVGLPQAGRNMLSSKGWEQIRALRLAGAQVFLVQDSSRYGLIDAQSEKPRVSAELMLEQQGKRFPLRHVAFAHKVRLTGKGSGVSNDATSRFFQTTPGDGFDIAQPFSVVLAATRKTDSGFAVQEFTHDFVIGDVGKWLPVLETPQWMKVWAQKRTDLAILVAGLIVLTLALAAQSWLSRSPRRLTAFRIAFLVYTLVFIGWWGQGQLTIVNMTSLLEAVSSGQSPDFLLADPMAVTLWAFVIVSLFVWGRGTFCGWLCPFGAFQELINKVARVFGLRQRTLHSQTDVVLKRGKYGLLAILLAAALLSSTWTERFVEVEPFKTAISMSFQRHWPYVLWAFACLGLSLFVYRGYCKYLCPLGAALAVLGKVRLLAWIPRRAECGRPCQTCRFRCDYQAISPSGKVDYQECFQCLDCVSIHQDSQRCLPLIVEARRMRRTIPLMPEPANQ